MRLARCVELKGGIWGPDSQSPKITWNPASPFGRGYLGHAAPRQVQEVPKRVIHERKTRRGRPADAMEPLPAGGHPKGPGLPLQESRPWLSWEGAFPGRETSQCSLATPSSVAPLKFLGFDSRREQHESRRLQQSPDVSKS